MSQPTSEIQSHPASQNPMQTQEADASHASCESQTSPASHSGRETQARSASHELGETPQTAVSHTACEIQTCPASQAVPETHASSASHTALETPTGGASHNPCETQQASAPTLHGELRFLVEVYYDCQKLRIEVGNRVGALTRAGEDAARLQRLADWVDQRLASAEADLKKMVQAEIKDHPLWRDWLKGVSGVGPCIAGGLIAWIGDIGRFDTVSKLWAFSGLHTIDGQAARRKAGEKANWNPQLKVLAWKAATSFVKVGKGYRLLYEQAKARYQAKFPEPLPYDPPRKGKDGQPLLRYTPAHVNNMALRWTAKIFFSHVYERWRELEGLPVRPPYALEHGHTTRVKVVEE